MSVLKVIFVFVFFFEVSSICGFFFFQAEDGIRDDLVTGDQTCALPICLGVAYVFACALFAAMAGSSPATCSAIRSEERRVGKECRSRCSPYHYKKKKRHPPLQAQASYLLSHPSYDSLSFRLC